VISSRTFRIVAVLLALPLVALVLLRLGRASHPRQPLSAASVSPLPAPPETEAPPRAIVPPEAPDEDVYSSWTTLEDAMAESQRSGKPILIDFNAAWCGPCHEMKRQVFDDGDRGSEVERLVIPVSIVDREHEDGENPPEIAELQGRYQVDAFPTLIVFSPRTGRSLRTEGFGGADQTIQWITAAARAVR
jgi:thiol:disulfide interchange protein